MTSALYMLRRVAFAAQILGYNYLTFFFSLIFFSIMMN